MSIWLGNERVRMEGPGSTLLNFIRDGICIAGLDNRIIFWNRAAEAVTGYESDEVIGEPILENIFQLPPHSPPENDSGEVVPLWFKQPQQREHIAQGLVRHKAGRDVPIKLSMSPIGEEDGQITGRFILFWDTTTELGLVESISQDSQVTKFLQRYVSRETFEMANSLARGDTCHTATQSEMTVMFVDIARFTSFAERSGPEEVRDLLNEFFAVCETAVLCNGGDIDKFIGDCVMSVFRTPDAAIKAGKDILHVLRGRNQEARARGGYELRVRIGAHTGPVVQGDIGGLSRKDCTVVGDAVNTAARLERLSDIDSLLISHATYMGLSDRSDFVFVGTTLIRGKSESLRLYVY